jgi:2-dehydropantoate 2-reductase
MTTPPRICIYGAGAVGGWIGTRLALGGADISVVARGKTLDAITRHGLRLITIEGKILQVPVKVSADPADLGPQDYIVVAVKAPALPLIATRLAPLIGPETAVVTAMNGVPWWFFANDNGPLGSKPLAAIDPDGRVIRHMFGNRLLIGEHDGRQTPRLHRLAETMREAGIDCIETKEIRREIWLKLWGNLSTNPISLLTETTLDRIIGDPLVETLVRRMMEEAEHIGEKIGVRPDLSVDELIAKARGFGPVKTSMLQDLERGTPVEIDALLTVIHDIGAAVHVPTPFIDSVLGLARLRASEHGLMDRVA